MTSAELPEGSAQLAGSCSAARRARSVADWVNSAVGSAADLTQT
jgi:hypothetical protein